jgi:3'-phosphoadenosine 5'-phosphosulfate sulfotransferase (PAPS reductase)/FAD synthetase
MLSSAGEDVIAEWEGEAILQFSGGKDSAALMHLMRPHLDRITVYYGDTGAAFPHVRAFVHELCDELGARLVVIGPPMAIRAYHALAGLPSDIVPVEATQEMAPYLADKPEQLLQSYTRCCGAMLWEPMQKAIRESGARTVLRGSKKADARVGVTSGHTEDGIQYLSPLWDWSDEKVLAYLEQAGVTLPAHYATVNDSLDCTICTAHLAHHGAAKMRFMREHYPELWIETGDRLRRLGDTLNHEFGRIAGAFMGD